MGHHLRNRFIVTVAGTFAAAFATGAMAAPAPNTRLISCENENCLLVTGHRASTASAISINGHAVTVEGGRSWRVRLPMDTVRAWAEPYARSIEVTATQTGGRAETSNEASLPIGLLGHATNLASLVVRAR